MNIDSLLNATDGMSREDLVRALFTDGMTRVWNRRAFEQGANDWPLAIVDLDSLKWINEALGHRNGDAALIALARILDERFPGNVYRIGGDEFVVRACSREFLLAGLLLAQNDVQNVTLSTLEYTIDNAAAFSFGIGGDLEQADKLLNDDKTCREASGDRASRGEPPPGVTVRLRVVK